MVSMLWFTVTGCHADVPARGSDNGVKGRFGFVGVWNIVGRDCGVAPPNVVPRLRIITLLRWLRRQLREHKQAGVRADNCGNINKNLFSGNSSRNFLKNKEFNVVFERFITEIFQRQK